MNYILPLTSSYQNQSFNMYHCRNQNVYVNSTNETEAPLTRKGQRWGKFYLRKCEVKRSPNEQGSFSLAQSFSRSLSRENGCSLPVYSGALEENNAGKELPNTSGTTCDPAGTEGSCCTSRQEVASSHAGTSSTQDRIYKVDENEIKCGFNEAHNDIPYAEDSSLVEAQDGANLCRLKQALHVCTSYETGNNGSSFYVLSEEKTALKSKEMATLCTENKQQIGSMSWFGDAGVNIITPSSLIPLVTLGNEPTESDCQEKKLPEVIVLSKSPKIPLRLRRLDDKDGSWSVEDCGVNKDQYVEMPIRCSTRKAKVVDSPGEAVQNEVNGSMLVTMCSANKCMNKDQSIKRKRRREHTNQIKENQVKGIVIENWGQSNDLNGIINSYDSYTEKSHVLKESLSCSEGVVQLKDSEDLHCFSPQLLDDCHLDVCEIANGGNHTNRTGPILRGRKIRLETNLATSVLSKHHRRLSTSTSLKRTLSRKSNLLDNKLKKAAVKGLLEDYLKLWIDKNVETGAFESEHCLPFLVHAPRRVECHQCKALVLPGKELLCTNENCRRAYHLVCAKKLQGHSWSKKREFKCPQHVCMVCMSTGSLWRCVRCPVAVHITCCPWPEAMTLLKDKPRLAICWRHHEDWRLECKHKERTNKIQEAFHRLPIPYFLEDFKIDPSFWKDVMENQNEPPPYVHIRRNAFLIKKKRDDADDGVGCSCGKNATVCGENCECRVQSMSCSKACKCSELCTNKPFRKEKKIKIVKTDYCGWGAEAAEVIKNGEFVIEYTGEVINDALCEERLWAMKHRGVQNFYMCEIGKDFIIDATFKGNPSRYLNHSCDPNCKLEKWRVDGETRVGVFAAKDISIGEPLTYDYRFIQFGPNVKCHCGAGNCQGNLGEPFGTNGVKSGSNQGVSSEPFDTNNITMPALKMLEWGCKRKRSCLNDERVLFQDEIYYGYCE